MRNRWQLFLALALVMMICLLALSGCSYRTFTLKEGIAHFSFEYPSNYKIHSVEVGDIYRRRGEYTDINMFTPKVGEKSLAEVHDAEIRIAIHQADSGVSNSTEALESFLSDSSKFYKDFKLFERSDITVDGIQGERVVFSYTSLIVMVYHIGMHIVRPSAVGRITYFDYSGKIWRKNVEGYKDLDNTLTAAF